MKLILVALAALAVTGCQAIQIDPTSPPVYSTAGSIRDEQALGYALDAHNLAVVSYLSVHQYLPADVKATVKASLQVSLRALRAARVALRAANATDFETQLALAVAATTQAAALLPKANP